MTDLFKLIGVLAIFFFGVKSCAESDWYMQHNAQQLAAEKAAYTPHVIREADGCKVYAFRADGREHYFTRCQNETITESSYTVNCGKGCTRTETEFIEVRK